MSINDETSIKYKSFRLYDYNVYDDIFKLDNNSNLNCYKDNKKFIIQAFGLTENNLIHITIDSRLQSFLLYISK